MTATTEPGERLVRLEGAYEHLATKADIERVRSDLGRDIERVLSDLGRDIERLESSLIKWFVGAVIASAVAASAIASAIAIWIAP